MWFHFYKNRRHYILKLLKYIIKPPNIKLIEIIIVGCLYKTVALFMPGISNENIEAESITPADIAIIEFIKFLFVFLNKNIIN